MEMLTDNPAKKLARQSSLSLEKGVECGGLVVIGYL